jgi:hypothetical protein
MINSQYYTIFNDNSRIAGGRITNNKPKVEEAII